MIHQFSWHQYKFQIILFLTRNNNKTITKKEKSTCQETRENELFVHILYAFTGHRIEVI